MYEFRDTNEHLNESWLPSVAMLFNGILLEEEIKGYQTLNVEGRETISYNLEDSGNISGRDGVITFGKTLPPRVLRIQYLLEASSNEELQHSFRLLSWKLQTNGEVPIRFRDDLEITYYGELVGMSEVPPETNNVVGTFEIHCSDPYKYEKETNQAGNPLTIYLPTPYEVKPELIEVTVKSTISKLIVANITTGRRIVLNGAYQNGDIIRIRLNETGQGDKITKNNQNIMKELDYLATDFNTFRIKKGDVLQVTPNTALLSVSARGAMEIEPIYLFDNKKELIDIVPAERLIDSSQDWTLNGLIKSSVTGVYSEVIEKAHYYGTRDIDEPDVFWQYKIISYTKQDNLFSFEGIYVLFDDLSGRGIVKDKRPNKAHTTEVLGYILDGTGWQIGNVYSSKKATSNHYYISKLRAFWDFIEKWRVEFKPRMTYSGGKVTGKYIDIYDKVSDDFGKWYEYGDSLLSVEAEEMRESVFTAFVGRGKGEEVGDGFGRKIGFKDVAWTTGAGKPVDKPINQDYVEIPWATALYGYEDGTPRMTVVDFPDIEDPSELLDATYEYALTACRPKVQFKSNVLETERADVGEVVTIIRDDIGIRYKTRIFNLKRNFLNKKVKTIQFGEQLVQSRSQSAKKTATAIKKQEEQTLNWLLAIRQALTDSYFNEDGYNYDLPAGNEYGWPGGYYSFNRPIDQNPTKVVYMGAGKILLANSKNPDGSWIWRTAMDGDGIVADEINVGTLNGLRFVNNFLNGTTPGQLVIDGDIKMTAGKIGFELNEERVLFEDATNKTTLGHDGLKFYRNDELIGEIKIEYFSSTGQTAVTLSNAKKGTNGIRINQNRIEVTERNQGANDLDIFVIPSGEGKILVSDPTKFSWKGVRALDYEFPKRSRIYETPDGGLEVQANATYTLRQGGGTYAFNVDASRMKLQRDLDMSGNKVTNTSDIRLKKNIEDATIDPLKQVNKMKFITAEWDKTNPFNRDKPDERFFGQVAQYAPTIMQVKNGIKDHYLSIDKGVQSDLNSMAIQELDKKTQRIETLEQELADLKSAAGRKGSDLVALDKFRSQTIVWDKANRKVYENVRVSSEDENGRKLAVQILNDGVVEDLTGFSLNLAWETRDKTTSGLDAFEVVDISKGQFSITYKTGMLQNVGNLNAQLVLVGTDTSKITSENFTITVFGGVGTDGAESSNEFSALTTALATVNQYDARIESKADKSTTEQSLLSLSQQLEQTEQDLTTQLAQTVKLDDAGVLGLNIFDEPSRNILQGQEPGTINAVLGEKNVKSENIDDGAVRLANIERKTKDLLGINDSYGVEKHNEILPNEIGSNASTSGTTRIVHKPVEQSGVIKQLKLIPTRAGNIIFKVFRKINNDTFEIVEKHSIDVVSGINLINVDIPIEKSMYIGYHSADTSLKFEASTTDYIAYKDGDIDNGTFGFISRKLMIQCEIRTVKVEKKEHHIAPNEVQGIIKQASSVNLFNKETRVLSGYYAPENGLWVESGIYQSSDFIPIELGDYKKSNTFSYALWDNEKVFLSGGSGSTVTIVNPKAVFVTTALRYDQVENFMFTKTSEYPDVYVPYKEEKYIFSDKWILPESDGNRKVGTSIGTNSDTFLRIPTPYPDGTEWEGRMNQTTHPSALYFKDGWNGHKFWLAYTPYAFSNIRQENPSIAVSDNGVSWEVPTGVTNPLVDAPVGPGYNSDVDLLHNVETNQLEIWYREVTQNNTVETIYRIKSSDGVNWSQPQQLRRETSSNALKSISPTAIYENGKYRLWVMRDWYLHLFESVDGTNWSDMGRAKTNDQKDIHTWHSSVKKIDGIYYLINCDKSSTMGSGGVLYYNTSNDGVVWSDNKEILTFTSRPWDLDGYGVYRGSLIYAEGLYYLYYGMYSHDGKWTIGLTTGKSMESLTGINERSLKHYGVI